MARKHQRRQQRRDRIVECRIGELPVDIVDKILGFLPIHQAARMAVLSTFWRDMWFSLTKLVFDSRFFFRIMRKYRTQTDSDPWMPAALYVINKVLNQHNGLIRTFVLDFKGYSRNSLRSRSFDFDQWLFFVTRKGVEEIFFSFMVGDDYRPPNCIFSCSTLRILYLDRVSVESMNAHCKLPNVTSLIFKNIDFHGVDLLVPVDFPMLKNISFIKCDNLSNLKITAQILDILVINNCQFYQLPIYSDLRSLRTIEVDSFSLEDFVKGCTRRELPPQPLPLNVEYLILSTYAYFTGDISSEFIHLLQACPKLSILDINLSFTDVLPELSDEFDTVAERLEMLRNLNLIEFVPCENHIVFIKDLLACFPALEEVVITCSEKRYKGEDIENYEELLDFYIEELTMFPSASTEVNLCFISG